MSVLLRIEDDLAARLRPRAEAERLSLEQFAIRVLGDAAEDGDEQHWRACNERRMALIRKQFAERLTPDEQVELASLQEIADRHLEEQDNQMLDDVQRLRAAADEVVKRSTARRSTDAV
jgi:hypothetical protein